MIRIVLLGRTGNNLFQYALGRVLATRHGVPLVMDGSWFNRLGWSEVSHFLRLPLRACVVRRVSLASRALRKMTGKHPWEYRGIPIIRENPSDQSFDRTFLNAPSDCMLFGYFQSPLYFQEIATELRAELYGLLNSPVRCHDGWDSLRSRLVAENSVAVHVRRGDYLRHPAFRVCDLAYFREAMNRMRGMVAEARFFVFSDDPDWCRKAFQEPDTEVVDSQAAGSNPLHDLHLMSLAGHHVISNSTYSWWAAWIGRKDGQLVMMPDRWYADPGIHAPIEEKRGGENWLVVSR